MTEVGKNAIPIIGVTANAIASQLGDCLAAGMNEIVTKPIDSQDLYEKIQKLGKVLNHDRSK